MAAEERAVRPVEYVSLHETVYRELKHLLLTRSFDPTIRLDTTTLERRLGVSRTPLKDALNRLAAEGFIEVRPRRGYFVRRPSLGDAMELFDLRLLHEGFAAERAVERAGDREVAALRALLERQRAVTVAQPSDEQYEAFSQLDRDLHRHLVDAAGNRQLSALYAQLDAHIQMARVYYLDARTTMAQTFREHTAIVDALEARDAAALKARLAAHIERFRGLVLKHLSGAAPRHD